MCASFMFCAVGGGRRRLNGQWERTMALRIVVLHSVMSKKEEEPPRDRSFSFRFFYWWPLVSTYQPERTQTYI